MKIDIKEVEHIAALSRLKLSDREKELFGSQLSRILLYIETLNQLDTKHIEPTSHVIDLVNVERADELRPSLPEEDALSNAPERSGGFYRVPKIIE